MVEQRMNYEFGTMTASVVALSLPLTVNAFVKRCTEEGSRTSELAYCCFWKYTDIPLGSDRCPGATSTDCTEKKLTKFKRPSRGKNIKNKNLLEREAESNLK